MKNDLVMMNGENIKNGGTRLSFTLDEWSTQGYWKGGSPFDIIVKCCKTTLFLALCVRRFIKINVIDDWCMNDDEYWILIDADALGTITKKIDPVII